MENYLEGKLLLEDARKAEAEVRELKRAGRIKEAYSTSLFAIALYAKAHYKMALDEVNQKRYLHALAAKSYLELLMEKGITGKNIKDVYREMNKVVENWEYVPFLEFASNEREKKAEEILEKYLEKVSLNRPEEIERWALRAKLVAVRFWERYGSQLLLLNYWMYIDLLLGKLRKIKNIHREKTKEIEKLEKILEKVQI